MRFNDPARTVADVAVGCNPFDTVPDLVYSGNIFDFTPAFSRQYEGAFGDAQLSHVGFDAAPLPGVLVDPKIGDLASLVYARVYVAKVAAGWQADAQPLAVDARL